MSGRGGVLPGAAGASGRAAWSEPFFGGGGAGGRRRHRPSGWWWKVSSCCDGHAENHRTRELFDEAQDDVVKRWHRDQQPHRENLGVYHH